MDGQIVVAVIGVGGVVLAALLSAVGYFMKLRLESKRSARRVLYYLLEIRYAINTTLIDPVEIYNEYVDGIVARFVKRGAPIDRSALEVVLGAVVYNHFVNIVDAIRVDIEERLLVAYDEALRQLAEIDPVLAYRLRGKERLQVVAGHTIRYSESLESEIIPGLPIDTIKSELLAFSSKQKGEALDELANEFNDEILMLARSCSIADHWKCKKVLKKSPNWRDVLDLSEIDGLIDQALEMIGAQATKAAS